MTTNADFARTLVEKLITRLKSDPELSLVWSSMNDEIQYDLEEDWMDITEMSLRSYLNENIR
jgi:hypothetical protein